MNRFYKFRDGRLLDITSIVNIRSKSYYMGDYILYSLVINFINFKINLEDCISYKRGLLWSRLDHRDLDTSMEYYSDITKKNDNVLRSDDASVVLDTIEIKSKKKDDITLEFTKLQEYIKMYYNEN